MMKRPDPIGDYIKEHNCGYVSPQLARGILQDYSNSLRRRSDSYDDDCYDYDDSGSVNININININM